MAVNKRVIVPKLRLETLDAGGTRCALYLTYASIIVGIVCTVILHIGLDRKTLSLDGQGYCNGTVTPFANSSDSDLTNACIESFTQYSPNGTVWTAVVNGLSRFDGGLQLGLSFPYGTGLRPTVAQLVYDVDVAGALGGGWVPISQLLNATLNLRCTSFSPSLSSGTADVLALGASSVSCAPAALFDSSWATYGQGGAGGFSAYRMSIAYHDASLAAFASNAIYTVSYTTAAFATADFALRLVFCLGTLIAAYMWLRSMCWRRTRVASPEGERGWLLVRRWTPPREWLSQQRWVGLLLGVTFLWLNPLYITTQALQFAAANANLALTSDGAPASAETAGSHVPWQLFFASSTLEMVGWCTLFAFWWTMVDGMKVTRQQIIALAGRHAVAAGGGSVASAGGSVVALASPPAGTPQAGGKLVVATPRSSLPAFLAVSGASISGSGSGVGITGAPAASFQASGVAAGEAVGDRGRGSSVAAGAGPSTAAADASAALAARDHAAMLVQRHLRSATATVLTALTQSSAQAEAEAGAGAVAAAAAPDGSGLAAGSVGHGSLVDATASGSGEALPAAPPGSAADVTGTADAGGAAGAVEEAALPPTVRIGGYTFPSHVFLSAFQYFLGPGVEAAAVAAVGEPVAQLPPPGGVGGRAPAGSSFGLADRPSGVLAAATGSSLSSSGSGALAAVPSHGRVVSDNGMAAPVASADSLSSGSSASGAGGGRVGRAATRGSFATVGAGAGLVDRNGRTRGASFAPDGRSLNAASAAAGSVGSGSGSRGWSSWLCCCGRSASRGGAFAAVSDWAREGQALDEVCCCGCGRCCMRRCGWYCWCGETAVRHRASHLYGIRHYPGPADGLAFYWPKILLFVLAVLVGTGLEVLSQPDVLFGQRDAPSNPLSGPVGARRLLSAIVGLGFAYIGIQVVWLILFAWSTVTTGRQLRKLPYAATRHQQLSYRMFVFQTLLVIAFVVAVNLLPVASFLIDLRKHPITSDVDTAAASASSNTPSLSLSASHYGYASAGAAAYADGGFGGYADHSSSYSDLSRPLQLLRAAIDAIPAFPVAPRTLAASASSGSSSGDDSRGLLSSAATTAAYVYAAAVSSASGALAAVSPLPSLSPSPSPLGPSADIDLSVETQVASALTSLTQSVTGVGEIIVITLFVWLQCYFHAPPPPHTLPGVVGKTAEGREAAAADALARAEAREWERERERDSKDRDRDRDKDRGSVRFASPTGASGSTRDRDGARAPALLVDGVDGDDGTSASAQRLSLTLSRAASDGAGLHLFAAAARAPSPSLRAAVDAVVSAPAVALETAGRAAQTLRVAIEGALLGLPPDAAKHRFSLATACWLFDMASCVYFDLPPVLEAAAHGSYGPSVPPTGTPSSFGPIPCAPHGFTVAGVAYSAETDTMGWVCRAGWRIVVVFRGTVTRENVRTDLSLRPESVEFGVDTDTRGHAVGLVGGGAAPSTARAPASTGAGASAGSASLRSVSGGVAATGAGKGTPPTASRPASGAASGAAAAAAGKPRASEALRSAMQAREAERAALAAAAATTSASAASSAPASAAQIRGASPGGLRTASGTAATAAVASRANSSTSATAGVPSAVPVPPSAAEAVEHQAPSIAAAVPGLRQALTLVHGGFWRAYSSVRPQIRSMVRSALVDAGPRARVYTCGHSLGGALATLAAYDLQPMVKEVRDTAARLGMNFGPGIGPGVGAGAGSRSGHGYGYGYGHTAGDWVRGGGSAAAHIARAASRSMLPHAGVGTGGGPAWGAGPFGASGATGAIGVAAVAVAGGGEFGAPAPGSPPPPLPAGARAQLQMRPMSAPSLRAAGSAGSLPATAAPSAAAAALTGAAGASSSRAASGASASSSGAAGAAGAPVPLGPYARHLLAQAQAQEAARSRAGGAAGESTAAAVRRAISSVSLSGSVATDAAAEGLSSISAASAAASAARPELLLAASISPDGLAIGTRGDGDDEDDEDDDDGGSASGAKSVLSGGSSSVLSPAHHRRSVRYAATIGRPASVAAGLGLSPTASAGAALGGSGAGAGIDIKRLLFLGTGAGNANAGSGGLLAGSGGAAVHAAAGGGGYGAFGSSTGSGLKEPLMQAAHAPGGGASEWLSGSLHGPAGLDSLSSAGGGSGSGGGPHAFGGVGEADAGDGQSAAQSRAQLLEVLLDEELLEGVDPLDCVGIPPHEDPAADAELEPERERERERELREAAAGRRPFSWGRLGGHNGHDGHWHSGYGYDDEERAGGGFGSSSSRGLGMGHRASRPDPAADVVCVTFGAPRVGNHVFARQYNARVPYTWRVCFDGDIVTSMPPKVAPNGCCGVAFYKHVGIETVVDFAGNVMVDPSFVERSLRTSAKTSLRAHRMASYRRALIHARRNEGLRQWREWVLAEALPPFAWEAVLNAAVGYCLADAAEAGEDGDAGDEGAKSLATAAAAHSAV